MMLNTKALIEAYSKLKAARQIHLVSTQWSATVQNNLLDVDVFMSGLIRQLGEVEVLSINPETTHELP